MSTDYKVAAVHAPQDVRVEDGGLEKHQEVLGATHEVITIDESVSKKIVRNYD